MIVFRVACDGKRKEGQRRVPNPRLLPERNDARCRTTSVASSLGVGLAYDQSYHPRGGALCARHGTSVRRVANTSEYNKVPVYCMNMHRP